MKRLLQSSIFVALLGFLCSFQTKDFKSGESVRINEPHAGNLYAAGGTVTVNAPIQGDLIVAGGTIVVNDSIQNDVLAAGGTLTFNGMIADDLRCAGGEIYLEKDVMGDVVMAGGQLTIAKGATIFGNIMGTGGSIRIDGTVKGEVHLASGDFVLNGTIANQLSAKCGKITINGTVEGPSELAAGSIELDRNAAFFGDVRYWSKDRNLDFGPVLKGGSATYDEDLQLGSEGWKIFGFTTILGVFWYFGTVLLMMVILGLLLGPVFKKASLIGLQDLGKTIGFGFLFVFGIPVLIVMAFLSLIGLPVGLILLFLYTLIMLFAATISSLVIAHWIQEKNQVSWPFWQVILIAFVIFIGLKILSIIPILGWIVLGIIVLIAFGAILRSFWFKPSALSGTA